MYAEVATTNQSAHLEHTRSTNESKMTSLEEGHPAHAGHAPNVIK